VPHQPGNTLAADANSDIGKINLQAWCSIRAFRGYVRRADFRDQRIIHHGTLRGRPLDPRVIAAGGDTQDAAHHGDGVTGPVLAHELEPFGGITSVSRANQAAAFGCPRSDIPGIQTDYVSVTTRWSNDLRRNYAFAGAREFQNQSRLAAL